MPILIDASLWVDFTRARSPQPLKEFISPYILDPAACLCEPVVFELLRHATPREARMLTQHFETFPTLPTPGDVWESATRIGQVTRQRGVTVASLDLLIAAVALAADAILVTFEEDFRHIARSSELKVEFLRRPA